MNVISVFKTHTEPLGIRYHVRQSGATPKTFADWDQTPGLYLGWAKTEAELEALLDIALNGMCFKAQFHVFCTSIRQIPLGVRCNADVAVYWNNQGIDYITSPEPSV